MKTNILQKGKLLIAEPSILNDNWFNRSVLLLVEHNEQGSVGFILNKPLEYTINDAVPEIEANFPLYNGGPVDQDNLYFIHTCPHLIRNSEMIGSELYWVVMSVRLRNSLTTAKFWAVKSDFFWDTPDGKVDNWKMKSG